MERPLILQMFTALFLFIPSALSLFGAGRYEAEFGKNDSIVIFNAASTADLVNELGSLYSEKTGIRVYSNPASSGTLARQIERGARADLFISASRDWMNYAVEQGLCIESSPFLENQLVLITPGSVGGEVPAEFTLSTQLPSMFEGRISIGDPEHVPAGRYAVEAFEYFGWMDQLSERILPAADVRGALLVVEMGETQLGVVYATDAAKSDAVNIAAVFPPESHKPILYYCGITPEAGREAEDLYEFMLHSREAEELYESFNFSSIE